MGPLIQRTISRLETTKLDQNVKSRVVADVEENVYFQLGGKKKERKKKGAGAMQTVGEGTLDC